MGLRLRKRKKEPEGMLQQCMQERPTKARDLTAYGTQKPEKMMKFGDFCKRGRAKILNLEEEDFWTADGSKGCGLIGENASGLRREDSLGTKRPIDNDINTQGKEILIASSVVANVQSL